MNRGGGGLGCLIMGIVSLVVAFYILKGLFYVLWWAAPALFVLALIINWRAVADTGKDFLDLLGRNPVAGLIAGVLGVIGFPVLALYLFLRALGYTQPKPFDPTMQGNRQAPPEEEFVEFEELESRPKYVHEEPEEPEEPGEPMEPMEPVQRPASDPPTPENPYDQLFK